MEPAPVGANGEVIGTRLCAIYRRLAPRVLDWGGLRRHIGEPSIVRTLADVADAFEVGHQTVRQNWRSYGMPGEQGRYDLVEILIWITKRDHEQAGRTYVEFRCDCCEGAGRSANEQRNS